MVIQHYPGYITREEAALRQKVQVRAINDQVKRKTIAHIRIDGAVYIKDLVAVATPPPNVLLSDLIWVPHFAEKNKITTERVYEQIIFGKVPCVLLCDRIYLNPNAPELLAFIQAARKK